MTTIDNTQIKNGQSHPEARGKRLKSLRMMTGLTRKAMQEKYDLSAGTLQGWEDGRYGGLTRKGAERILSAIIGEGVHCNLDWLLFGTGIGPHMMDTVGCNPSDDSGKYTNNPNNVPSVEIASIMDELLHFRKRNPGVIDMMIGDDGMYPHYQIGDFVAGRRRTNDRIAGLWGLDCIVQTSNGEVLLRRLRKGSSPHTYTLVCTNENTSVLEPVKYDVSLVCAAPVIWLRRKDLE